MSTIGGDPNDVSIVHVYANSILLLNAYGVSASCLLALFFYTRFLLEPIVLPKVWGTVYTSLSALDKRSYCCHHTWLTVKILTIPGAWPFINILFLGKRIDQPLFDGALVSNGDMLSLLYLGILSMFAFELIYRLKVSPVSLVHHVAAIVLAIWQISGEVRGTDMTPQQALAHNKANDSQFKLIMLYGVFEVVFETYPHFATIMYRYYKGQHAICRRIWLAGGVLALSGSLAELVCVAVYMALNWNIWGIELKVLMPILHFCFMAAQLHGARIFFAMSRKFARLLRDQRNASPASDKSELPEKAVACDVAAVPSSANSSHSGEGDICSKQAAEYVDGEARNEIALERAETRRSSVNVHIPMLFA